MASNLDYLDPSLLPLEEKVNAFLEREKALQRANAALKSAPVHHQETVAAPPGLAGQAPTGKPGQEIETIRQNITQLRAELAQLEQEIIAMLPTRDEWLKVNLGYGPSRVGAWHVPASAGQPERYELRIVH
jgi:hypothetical protein